MSIRLVLTTAPLAAVASIQVACKAGAATIK
jgi:hypothetical protein